MLVSIYHAFDQQKVDLYQNMIDIATAMLSGPRPGVDYGKLTADIPKIRAEIECIDEYLFKAFPLIFSILIDPMADSKNRLQPSNNQQIRKGQADR